MIISGSERDWCRSTVSASQYLQRTPLFTSCFSHFISVFLWSRGASLRSRQRLEPVGLLRRTHAPPSSFFGVHVSLLPVAWRSLIATSLLDSCGHLRAERRLVVDERQGGLKSGQQIRRGCDEALVLV